VETVNVGAGTGDGTVGFGVGNADAATGGVGEKIGTGVATNEGVSVGASKPDLLMLACGSGTPASSKTFFTSASGEGGVDFSDGLAERDRTYRSIAAMMSSTVVLSRILSMAKLF
jgi:hypothetical protein